MLHVGCVVVVVGDVSDNRIDELYIWVFVVIKYHLGMIHPGIWEWYHPGIWRVSVQASEKRNVVQASGD